MLSNLRPHWSQAHLYSISALYCSLGCYTEIKNRHERFILFSSICKWQECTCIMSQEIYIGWWYLSIFSTPETYFSYAILLSTFVFFATGFMGKVHTSECIYFTLLKKQDSSLLRLLEVSCAILYTSSSRVWWILWTFGSFLSSMWLEVCALMRSNCSLAFPISSCLICQ